jgi:hypothetical protein
MKINTFMLVWRMHLSPAGTQNAMKTIILALLILCTAAAFGQTAGSISSQVSTISIPEHVLHADHHDLAQERPLVGGGSSETYTYATGERPLWEFGPMLPPPTPLGDVARSVRKEKLAAKKAEIILEKQGS